MWVPNWFSLVLFRRLEIPVIVTDSTSTGAQAEAFTQSVQSCTRKRRMTFQRIKDQPVIMNKDGTYSLSGDADTPAVEDPSESMEAHRGLLSSPSTSSTSLTTKNILVLPSYGQSRLQITYTGLDGSVTTTTYNIVQTLPPSPPPSPLSPPPPPDRTLSPSASNASFTSIGTTGSSDIGARATDAGAGADVQGSSSTLSAGSLK